MKASFHAMSVMALAVAAMAIPAHATITVKVTDGANVFTTVGTDIVGGSAAVVDITTDPNFTILGSFDQSNAGGTLPAALTFNGTVTLLTSNAASLKIEVSDTGFSLPGGLGNLTQTMNVNTTVGLDATGTLTSTGYYGTGAAGNVLFCQEGANTCSATTPTTSFNTFAATAPGQTNSVGVTFAPPFSLDEVVNLTFNGNQSGKQALFQGTLSATVPEPASVALLGGILLFVSSKMRKSKKSV